MNKWKGEELYLQIAWGKKLHKARKIKQKKKPTGERAKFQNGKYSVLIIKLLYL